MKVAIITGSTRPGRKSDTVAGWVYEIATKRDDAVFEIVDLVDYALPLFDEWVPPMAGRYMNPHTTRCRQADALEHWASAAEHGASAAEHWASAGRARGQRGTQRGGTRAGRPARISPYFWSDWYGQRIQFVGIPDGDHVHIAGDVMSGRFVAIHRDHDRVVGALAVARPSVITKLRKLIGEQADWAQALAEQLTQRHRIQPVG